MNFAYYVAKANAIPLRKEEAQKKFILKNNKIKLYKSCKNRKCTYYSKKTTEKKNNNKKLWEKVVNN